MKAMRQILSDRMLATVLAVVFSYLLAFQGFTGNMARASMVIAVEDPFHIVCSASAGVEAGTSGSDNPRHKGTECPCATLCRMASSGAFAVLAPGFFSTPSSQAASIDVVFPSPAAPEPARRGILADARGPPLLS
jgi:hypothetical protein